MKSRLSLLLVLTIAFTGCDKKDVHDHPHPPGAPEGPKGGVEAVGHNLVPLGEGAAGPYKVVATRDEGPVRAGGDAPIDVRVTPAGADARPVAAVRFWIGAADARGSVKAKAVIEDRREPARWHAHAEVPDPLAADTKLYVEVEAEGGATHVASFDLKR